MNSQTLREAARSALPAGAFLRRDRGEALFATDAPRLRPDADWPEALARTGFACELRDGLALISPGPKWLAALERAWPAAPDDLCRSLARFAGLEPDGESLRLFALGARQLDGEGESARFERRLRQRAAECLRLNAHSNQTRGGGLYACALMNHIIREAST